MINGNSELIKLRNEASKYSKGRVSRFLRRPIRTVLPKLMRSLGVTKEVVLPLFWGARFFGVLPEAVTSLIWRFGYFDPKTSVNILKELPQGGVFVDVGAHFGYFTLLASAIVGDKGKVIAVEAMPSTFERLKYNIKRNELEARCFLVNRAAYDKETTLDFKDYGLALSSLNSAFGIRNDRVKTGGAGKNVAVKAVTLDSILEERLFDGVDLIKIDAESSEYFVLRGMKETLKKYHPTLIVELGDEGISSTGKSTKEIIRFLDGFGYIAYELGEEGLTPVPEQERYSYCNLVFK